MHQIKSHTDIGQSFYDGKSGACAYHLFGKAHRPKTEKKTFIGFVDVIGIGVFFLTSFLSLPPWNKEHK